MALPSDVVYSIDPLQDVRWVDLITRHPNASVFHSRGWLDALRTTYGYEPVAFTTSAPTEPLTNALLFCKVRSWLTGSRLVSLPFSDHCEPLVESGDQFKSAVCLRGIIQAKRTVEVCGDAIGEFLLEFHGRFHRATTYQLHRLDLRPSLDALRKGFHKDCIQRKIARAERESLGYEAGHSPQLVRQLYELLQLTRSRHHLPPSRSSGFNISWPVWVRMSVSGWPSKAMPAYCRHSHIGSWK